MPTQQRLIPPDPHPEIPQSLGRATVATINMKSILNDANGFIASYHKVINPYRGCTFACDYCYASNFTQSEALKQDWGNWVEVKTNAVRLFNIEPKGSLNGKSIYMATATDPYQPIEGKVRITRALLEQVLQRHPRIKLVVQTRAPLVCRDIDLFTAIQEAGGRVQVNMTVTTDSETVRKTFEPGCPSTPARLRAAAQLTSQGIQTCITITPMLPLEDPLAFASQLRETGVTRFIAQEFHLGGQANRRNIAKTDARAIQSAMKHYDCDQRTAIARYLKDYQQNVAVLNRELPSLAFGKAGFAPPF